MGDGLFFRVGVFAGREEIALDCVALVQAHRAVIGFAQHQQKQHEQRGQRVQIIWNGFQKHPEAVDVVLLRDRVADGGCPAGNRCDDADRRRGGVQEVGEFRAGDLVAVRHRPHDRSDRHAVEAVIDKDQDAHQDGGKLRADAGFDVFFRPSAEGLRAAGAVHQHDQRAEQNDKVQNADVR